MLLIVIGSIGARLRWCLSILSLLSLVLQLLTIQIAIMLAIDHFRLHLVVDAHITSHRLFVVLELHFHLLGGHICGSLAQGVFIHVTVFVTAHLLLDIESLLLLQVEVFDSLVVLSIVALIRLWLSMLHGWNLLSGRRYLLLLGHLKVRIALQTLGFICLETLQFRYSLLPLLF